MGDGRTQHWVAMSVLAVGIAAACANAGVFSCTEDADCVSSGPDGVCESTGGCSFPDDACETGRRYGDYAPDGLGGMCVALDGGTSAGDGPLGSTGVPPTSGGVGDSTTTLAVDASGSGTGPDPTTGTSVDPTGDSDGSTGGAPPATFFDDFDRPDGLQIGNDWIEKTPAAFRLLDGQVELETVNGQNFRDNLVYRPASESMLEVEAYVAVDFTTDQPLGFPQLHLRVQAGDVDTPGSLTSYAVFVDTNDPLVPKLTVNRIAGPGFGPEDSTNIMPVPIDAESYRLRGRVTGTDPVVVEGRFEVWDAASAAWQIRTTTTLVDDTVDRITTPGTLGIGGHDELQYFVLDDFGYDEQP